MIIREAIPAEDIPRAAALYWQAFRGKLGLLMQPDQTAVALIAKVMRADHGLAAYDQGTLVGIAGFKTPEGAFVDGTLADFRQAYGVVSGTCRALLLALLERDVDNTNFLMDGICVDAAARGKGVGTALLAQIEQQARQRGYSSVRLDVIDENDRARALYERQGFVATRVTRLGVLRHLFGFAQSTTMVKDLAA